MTPGDREALEALGRRLDHAGAIAELLAAPDDTRLGEAMRGVALMIGDVAAALDRIVNPTGPAVTP